jgi:hypothetical protein
MQEGVSAETAVEAERDPTAGDEDDQEDGVATPQGVAPPEKPPADA